MSQSPDIQVDKGKVKQEYARLTDEKVNLMLQHVRDHYARSLETKPPCWDDTRDELKKAFPTETPVASSTLRSKFKTLMSDFPTKKYDELGTLLTEIAKLMDGNQPLVNETASETDKQPEEKNRKSEKYVASKHKRKRSNSSEGWADALGNLTDEDAFDAQYLDNLKNDVEDAMEYRYSKKIANNLQRLVTIQAATTQKLETTNKKLQKIANEADSIANNLKDLTKLLGAILSGGFPVTIPFNYQAATPPFNQPNHGMILRGPNPFVTMRPPPHNKEESTSKKS